jgi:hypothetical protein
MAHTATLNFTALLFGFFGPAHSKEVFSQISDIANIFDIFND